jgi:transcriptional regulator with XRE-family HTH domain
MCCGICNNTVVAAQRGFYSIMEHATIDKDWFVLKLERAGKSLRGMARFVNVDGSAMSRMLSGQRKMKMDEITRIARFLDVPVEEVLEHAGVPVTGAVQAAIMLAATIGDGGVVEDLPSPQPLPSHVAVRAEAAITLGQTGHVIAAQVRASKGALSIWDDAVVLFVESAIVEPTAVGVLSIARLRDGIVMLAHIEKARKTGEATVKLPGGELKDVQLMSASPVLAVIP